MNEIFNIESWREVIVNSLSQLGANIAQFLPNLIGTIVLLVFGWVVSKLLEVFLQRVLRRLGLDQAAARVRLMDTLKRAGIATPPSRLLGRLLFWVLMLTFVLSAVETLGLTAVTATIDRLIGFIPNAIAAGLIVLFGLLLGRLVRNVTSSTVAAANMVGAQRAGAVSGGLVVLLVAVLALEQLGVETALLVTVLTAFVAAVSLSIGISLALGARPVVTHILAGHFLRQSLPHGSTVEVGGRKGTVEKVGSLATLLRDGEGSWSIPNATLIDERVTH